MKLLTMISVAEPPLPRLGYTAVDLLAAGVIALSVALWGVTRFSAVTPAETANADHLHRPGAHGGVLVSFANDNQHAEFLLEPTGRISVYTLERDETEVAEVDLQQITLTLRDAVGLSQTLTLAANPTPGDATGKTSRFTGTTKQTTWQAPLHFTVDNLRINGKRYRWGGVWEPEEHAPAMPNQIPASQAEQLYLTPGGLYTDEDIAANGKQTAAQAFVNFQAQHDFRPQAGDLICPITRTKANPACSWIIGGETYHFCCPPCIDEFVRLAKTDPDQIESPSGYVQP